MIQEFKAGDQIQGFFRCNIKEVRNTKTGSPYIHVTLSDKSGKIDGKIWENAAAFQKTFEQGDPVAVKARVTTFQNIVQLDIIEIAIANHEKHRDYGFDAIDLLPASKQNPDEMWQEIMEIINGMSNQFLKTLSLKLYSKYESIIKTHPASMTLHHAVYGGFQEHVLSMLKLAAFVAKHYNADPDLLLTGVLLHDIGKIKELKTVEKPGYTDEGILLGHVVMGRDMLIETAKDITDFPKETLIKLEHIVLSHQGKYEWQSPAPPKFKEALLVHFIDEMDARMNMMENAILEDKEQGTWTSRRNYFRVSLLKKDLFFDESE